jgi:glycosyltransferase involved in cell wall biosynthesis
VSRVCWIVDGPLGQLSGGYLYDRLIVEYLRRHGLEVAVVSLPTGSYGSRLARGLSLDLLAKLSPFAPDVVVQDELSHPALGRANRRLEASWPELRRVGLVHHLRSSEPRATLANFLYRWIEQRYLRTLDAFIFNSRTTRASVLRLDRRTVPSVVAVPGADRLATSLEPEAIRARGLSAGPLQVLFLGNLIRRKGLLTLIEAVALLPSGTVELTVAGSQEVERGHARRLRRRVESLRLGPIIRFLGVLDGQDLAQVMLKANLLAVPSTYEGYGMAYLEGMGCGLPAVAGVDGGAAEFVSHAENGFLVDPSDPAALAVHLGSLHNDRARLVRMSLGARQTFLNHPTWEQTGSVIRAFLASLAGHA